jgi:hypothetical protein
MFSYENWESAEALNAHLNTPYLQRFSAIPPWLVRRGLPGTCGTEAIWAPGAT